ncbi:DUF3139 domain-containing protein [Neobacillus sp. WH10]|uniref:DUF3139 domain-containing protein n=1 Tax=Neobacillus sp. WH10 TaxID=3047873 RepID=UPI0024C0F131|nr:DUF3139 domain-containing protein [Neobacillus sp. WH10]WHY77344.1 DUF3139 domain-containing protein [Neobacillus sp. WH10]
MKKKYTVITAIILIPIILIAGFKGFMFYNKYNKENAKKSIYDYIARQGINENQLKYADFYKDYKEGGYILAVYVEGEKPDIFYEYSYRDGEVFFDAYDGGAEAIKQKIWGGRGLEGELTKLKYPPLK